MEFTCYKCGQPGHIKSQCPAARPVPAPAPGLPPAPSPRPEDKPVPLPVPLDQRAAYGDVSPVAEALRARMGWTLRSAEARALELRARAAEQVAESRAARANWPANLAHEATPPQPEQPLDRWAVLPGDPAPLILWLSRQA